MSGAKPASVLFSGVVEQVVAVCGVKAANLTKGQIHSQSSALCFQLLQICNAFWSRYELL